MEVFYLIGFITLIILIVKQVEKRQTALQARANEQAQSACMTCAFAHIAQGFGERQKLIACTFGGTARQLKFAVSACTLYCFRGALEQKVQVAGFGGFAQETANALIAAKTNH